MGKKYFPQTLLEECEYKFIKKKIFKDLVTDDFNLSTKSEFESDDESSNDESDDESSNE